MVALLPLSGPEMLFWGVLAHGLSREILVLNHSRPRSPFRFF